MQTTGQQLKSPGEGGRTTSNSPSDGRESKAVQQDPQEAVGKGGIGGKSGTTCRLVTHSVKTSPVAKPTNPAEGRQQGGERPGEDLNSGQEGCHVMTVLEVGA